MLLTPRSASMGATVNDQESGQWRSRGIDTSVVHSARQYNYLLGGKDNFAADRQAGDAVAAVFPTIRTGVRENRRFLRRAVTYLAREAGIRQFLDIGTGLPSADNTHEVAQAAAAESRIVYVDNDPLVLTHARALLTSSPEGATAYLEADLRDPDRILADPELHSTLDLTKPVGLMLVAVLHFLTDADDPYEVVARLVSAIPSGSHVVISHVTNDFMPPETTAALKDVATTARIPGQFRSRDEIARLLDGLELVPPGLVPIAEWRADEEEQPRPSAAEVAGYAAVARKP
jgi:hypothetical protein